MSILTELLEKKITFSEAAAKAEQWGAEIARNLASDPTVVQTTGALVSTLKQDASDAVALADTLAGPIIAGSATAVESTLDAMYAAYFGPFAPIASKASHDAADKIAAGVIALVNAKAAEFKASMQAQPVPQPQPAG